MDKKELIAEWIRYAEMDLTTAKFDFENMHPAPLEIICYHCQQAAEKFLKAIIIYFGEEPEKTHDISKLLNVIKNFVDIPVEFRLFAIQLTQYAVHTRYPDAISVDEDQTKNAIAQAEQVKLWTEKITAEKSSDQNNKEDDTTNNPTD